MVTIPEEQTNELRSGIVSGFNKSLNEALSILPSIKYWVTNRVKPALLMGVLKGASGTPGMLAAISAEKDSYGQIRVATTELTALRGKEIDGDSNSVTNDDQPMKLVGSKKIFYVMAITLSYVATAAVAGALANIHIVRVTKPGENQHLIYMHAVGTNAQTQTLSFATPLPLHPGDAIHIQSSALTVVARGTVSGWEENA